MFSRFVVTPGRYIPIGNVQRTSDSQLVEGIDQETGLKVLLQYRAYAPEDERTEDRLLLLEILSSNTHPATVPLEGYCMNPEDGIRALIAFPFYSNRTVMNVIQRGGRESVLNATRK
jgi:hypothetical protein